MANTEKVIFDEQLIEQARTTLDQRFGDQPGAAAAAYTLEGNCYTSVSVACSSAGSSVEPETGAICEASKQGERISALVTLQRVQADGPVVFATPSGATLDRLATVGAREAEIACHDFRDAGNYHIRPQKSLNDSHHSEVLLTGNFNDGFAPLSGALRDFTRIQATPSAKADWPAFLRWGFANELVRGDAQKDPTVRHYLEPHHPHEVKDVALRHIYFAFEAASYHFFSSMFDAHEEAFRRLDLNDTDMLHLRQGATSLRYVFANLIVWVNWHDVVESEAPFVPSLPSRLHDGLPMHLVMERGAGEVPNEEVSRLLTTKGPGGLAAYLRQRKLFQLELFPNGTRRCPFEATALTMLSATGVIIDELRERAELLGA